MYVPHTCETNLLLIPSANHNVPVFARKDLVWDNGRVRGTMPPSLCTSNQIVGRDIREAGQLSSVSVHRTQLHAVKERTCDSKRFASIQQPLPVCWREMRAAIIAPWVYRPVAMSVTATPTLDGGRSGSPVLHRVSSTFRWPETMGRTYASAPPRLQ